MCSGRQEISGRTQRPPRVRSDEEPDGADRVRDAGRASSVDAAADATLTRMFPHGAVFFAARSEAELVGAFHEATATLGYEVADEWSPDTLATRIVTSHAAQAACLLVELPKLDAMALGHALAKRLEGDVRVFTATVLEAANRSFECLVDDVVVSADGTSKSGSWAADLENRVAGAWSEVSDDKAHAAVTALANDAVRLVLPGGTARPGPMLRARPSLGSSRLDAMAARIRGADRVQLTQVGGRDCLRITTADASVLSFVDADDLAALRAARLLPA